MEKPSSYLQVALGSLAFVAIGTVLTLYAIANQLIVAVLPDMAVPFLILVIAIAFFALPTLWWRNTAGYISAIVFAVLAIVNTLLAIVDVIDENVAQEALIIIIPGLIMSVVLIGSTIAAWRE